MQEIEIPRPGVPYRSMERIDSWATLQHEWLALAQRAVVALEHIAEESREVLAGRHRELAEHVRRCEERLAGMKENERYATALQKALESLIRFEADHPWLPRLSEGAGDGS